MKKAKILFKILLLSFTFLACDPPRYYDYHIINNCMEDIEVKIEVNNRYNSAVDNYNGTQILYLQVTSNTTQLITSSEYWQPLTDNMIEMFFKEIVITKGNETSKINYVNKNLWKMTLTSKKHANCYLTINPDDFE